MIRLTLKTMRANKIRFALTTFGVMLAVSFVVAAFVLGDGLRSSFTTVSEDVTAGVDLEVRNAADFGEVPPLPADTVAVVASVDGVADAVAGIESADNAVRPLTADGESLPITGPPQLAFSWIDNPELSPFTLVDGAPPQVGEFTMDVDSATKHHFVIGDTYEFMVPDGRVDLRMSGTSSFGADNSTLGAVLVQVNTAQASELFGVDGIDRVAVQVADGADAAAVQASVQSAVATVVPTAEVVDHATVLDETTTEFTQEIDLVGNILLGFGGVALFVSVFIIYNTFAIVLGQRTRELALLRTVGADPAQVRRSVLGEAVVMGVIASAGGIAAGVGIAKGIDALFGAMGVDLVDWPLILSTRTLVAAVVLGIGVTMLAAVGPARRASTVPPVTALTGSVDAGDIGSRRRMVAGAGLFLGGLAAGAAGLAGVGPTAASVSGMAVGAIAIFVGVTLLGPLAVRGVTAVLGWPVRRIGGTAGRLAQKNAARNPRRTTTTAAALMIGLTLVSTALVVGASVKATIGSAFDRAARADYYLTDELEEVTFPQSLVDDLRGNDAVAAAAGFTYVDAKVDGTVTGVVGADFDQIGTVLDLGVTDGGFTGRVANPIVVSVDAATAVGKGVGDQLTVQAPSGREVDGTIVGLFDDQAIVTEDYVVDSTVLSAIGIAAAPEWIGVTFADDASPASVDTVLAGIAEGQPYAAVETAAEFRDRVEGMVDGILTMVNVMVALAVVIALIGIANTLALSVFERTRELGLVRAVGMTRRQVRRMVRMEAALIAAFGATLGVGLGLLFGSGVVAALPESFASGLTVPAVPILVVVVVSALAGVAAAWLPARRAGRLDVLDAVAH